MRELFDFVFSFVTAVGTSVDDQTSTTRVTTSGTGGFDFEGGESINDDEGGELGENQEMFGMLGSLARPLGPETIDGKEYRAEAVAARTADGLVPFAWRDLRLDRYFPNGIPEGSFRTVGYGGGFSSLDGTAKGENTHTIYIPYDFDGDTPQKAHSIIVQPNPADGIAITHADGYQIALTEENIMMRTPDAETFLVLKEGEFNVSAEKIVLKGNVYMGQSAELGVALLPGVASPPGPSVFISPD